ncbi:hypothetical protein [Streptomyces montanisoli]|uniref:ATP-binding protein n=1 Tax=Streptomyces montanisoli TaxID=2798581 RepID=A0A940RYH5_9ACTN|nr:hypothetical protein [Streptomyces montanisoli]MBP0461590.1 hypothetical protein [Streptomyces montanisoli]
MKSMKVAAIVTGSLVVLGGAAPAFANGLTPSSLNGGINEIAANGLRSGSPINTNALDTENKGSLVNAVSDTAQSLGKQKQAKKQDKAGKAKTGSDAGQGVGSLLGGLPLGG